MWSSTGCLQKVSHINGKPPKPGYVSHTPLHLLLCSPHSIPCPIPTYSTCLRDPRKAFYGPLPGVRRRSHIKVPLVAYLLRVLQTCLSSIHQSYIWSSPQPVLHFKYLEGKRVDYLFDWFRIIGWLGNVCIPNKKYGTASGIKRTMCTLPSGT